MAPQVSGTCDPAFEDVRAQFEQNLTERGDVGASVSIRLEGRPVVDLWGGFADEQGTPWREDTLACVYSVVKGATSLCAHILAAAGELDLDAPVAHYWPKFAQAGKEDVTITHLLSHEAGLIGPRGQHGPEVAYDWEQTCDLLAETEPWWEPGSRQGYHAVTFGYLVGEVVRRITGLSLGTFLAKEVTSRLGADVFVGTPDTEHDRCAEMIGQPDILRMAATLPGVPDGPVTSLNQHPLAPAIVALGHLRIGDANTPEFRRAEIPGSNGHATARGLATMYDAILSGEILGAEALERAIIPRPMPGGMDVVLSPMNGFAPPRLSWGLGFQINQGRMGGASARAFGHGGIAGSMAFADPEHGVAFAYVTNTFAQASGADVGRLDSLVEALYGALATSGVA